MRREKLRRCRRSINRSLSSSSHRSPPLFLIFFCLLLLFVCTYGCVEFQRLRFALLVVVGEVPALQHLLVFVFRTSTQIRAKGQAHRKKPHSTLFPKLSTTRVTASLLPSSTPPHTPKTHTHKKKKIAHLHQSNVIQQTAIDTNKGRRVNGKKKGQ